MFCRHCGCPMKFGQNTCPECKGKQEDYIQSNVELGRPAYPAPQPPAPEPAPPNPIPKNPTNVIMKIFLGAFVLLLILDIVLFIVILRMTADAHSETLLEQNETTLQQETDELSTESFLVGDRIEI